MAVLEPLGLFKINCSPVLKRKFI